MPYCCIPARGSKRAGSASAQILGASEARAMRAPSRRPANCGGARLGGPCRQGAGLRRAVVAARRLLARRSAAAAADGGWPRIRGLRRCRGRRVVRCSALRSWLEELRSLPRSSVVARRRARGRARAVYNGAGAAGRGRRGEPPPRRRRLQGRRRPRWAQPRSRRSWELGGSDLSQRYVCLANRAAAGARAPRRPGVPRWRRRRRPTSPRPSRREGGAYARGGPPGAGEAE